VRASPCERPSARRADGPAAAASDFQCTLTCAYGAGAASLEGGQLGGAPAVPAQGIFQPPYAISNANTQLNISSKTLAVTARHADGTLEYDAHNLYGYYEAVATARALRAVRGRRHFSFSRCARAPPRRRGRAACRRASGLWRAGRRWCGVLRGQLGQGYASFAVRLLEHCVACSSL